MTHDEIKILISAYADGEATPSEKNIVEEHIASCAECQKDLKAYKGISSSLLQWSNESLSPDEEIKITKHFKRREPMFTKQSVTALTTTLALTIIIGSVVQMEVKRSVQGRLKSSFDDIGDRFASQKPNGQIYRSKVHGSDFKEYPQAQPSFKAAIVGAKKEYWEKGGLDKDKSVSYEPYYLQSNSNIARDSFSEKRLAEGTVAYDVVSGKALSAPLSPTATNYYQGGQNAAYYGLEEERKKIQRADLTLQVENAFKIKSQLTDLILQSNGIIVSSGYSRSTQGSGQGTMVAKVYPKDLESVLQQIRKLGEVQNENESSVDVTDQYADANKNMTKYKADKERLEKTLNGFKLFNPTTEAEKENTQRQITQTQDEIKAVERVIHFYEEQTSMSLVVVNYYDNYKTVSKEENSTPKWQVRLANKWKSTLNSSMEVFTNILFGSVFLLSYIVPLLLWCGLFTVIYLIVRLFIKK
jgi:hypothetical protein